MFLNIFISVMGVVTHTEHATEADARAGYLLDSLNATNKPFFITFIAEPEADARGTVRTALVEIERHKLQNQLQKRREAKTKKR